MPAPFLLVKLRLRRIVAYKLFIKRRLICYVASRRNICKSMLQMMDRATRPDWSKRCSLNGGKFIMLRFRSTVPIVDRVSLQMSRFSKAGFEKMCIKSTEEPPNRLDDIPNAERLDRQSCFVRPTLSRHKKYVSWCSVCVWYHTHAMIQVAVIGSG